MHRTGYLFFFLWILIAVPLRSQQMNFSSISSQLNLPSDECYNVVQDKKGYIWIATENGLCRYNGSSTRIYDSKSGLPERGVYYMGETPDGVFRIMTSRNRVLRISGDSLVNESFTQAFEQYLHNSGSFCYLLNMDDEKNIIVSTNNATYRISHTDNSIENLTQQEKLKTFLAVVTGTKDDYLIKSEFSPPGWPKKEALFSFRSQHGTKVLRIPVDKNEIFDWRLRLCRAGGYTFICFNNKLIRVDKELNYTVTKMPGTILSVYADRNNGLWLGLYQEGMCYYRDVSDMEAAQHLMEQHSVTGTLMDREGAVWCTTLDKGVFYCNNLAITDYANIPELGRPADMLQCVGDRLFIATANYSYMVLDRGRFYTKEFSLPEKHTIATGIFPFRNKLYFTNKGYAIRTDMDFSHRVLLGSANRSLSRRADLGLYQLDTCGGTLYGISYKEVYRFSGDLAVAAPLPFKSWGKCILSYNDSTLLVGHQEGIFSFNTHTGVYSAIPGFASYTVKMIRTRDGQVLVITKGDGLLLLENGRLRKISLGSDISPVMLDIVEDKYRTLWIASATGLLKVKQEGGLFRTQKLSTSNGLPSIMIRHVATCGEMLYVSTGEGLCSFPLKLNLLNTVPPAIFIRSILVNGRPVDLSGTLRFSYTENSLTAGFDALTYKNGNTTRLLYKLAGHGDAVFKTAAGNELNFDNLAPDTYELVVYALNNDGLKSIQPVYLHFVIRKPFWETTWFIVLVVLGACTIALILVIVIIRRIKRREEEKTAVNKLISGSQLSALQAQMNPHFIFNAINSIQNYILNNQGDEAYSYLAKFSKLIRMVLDNSRKSSLPLSAELSALKLYIALEQLRFKNSFSYSVSIGSDLDTDEVCVPAMLVQPYVENAIWHGLMNLGGEREGRLSIQVSRRDELLSIVIEDNGIGREQARRYKKEDVHTPVAMQLTEKRLLITQQMLGYKNIRVTITDLYSDAGKACGTRVELWLPLLTE